jgi:hypothetical protein
MKKYIAVIILAIGLGAVVESQTSYIYWTVGLNTPAVTTTTLTVTGSVLLANGSASSPSLTFAGDTDTGIYYHTGDNSIRLVFDGVGRHILTLNQWQLNSNSAQLMLGTSSADAAVLTRDAANVLALKNGTNAQEFRVYGTTAGPKYLKLQHDGGNVVIGTNDASPLRFATNNTNRWFIGTTSGSLLAQADNTYDIGQAGSLRPRNVYIAGAYYGNGNNLTGIAGVTGGVANDDNTNIVADDNNDGTGVIDFSIDASSKWRILNTGHLIGVTDNTVDIGAEGATRPRAIYVGTNVTTPLLTLTQGTITDAVLAINSTVTWNDAADTFTAWKLNVTDTASAATSLLMDLQVGGVSKFSVLKTGAVVSSGHIFASNNFIIGWSTRSVLRSPASGLITLLNSAGDDFSRLMFGGTTDAFPALKRTAADIEIVGAAEGITSGLIIQSIKATSGTRFVCVDTNGKLVSSTTACSGT